MKMKNFELQRVENLGSTMDSIGVDHSNRGQLYAFRKRTLCSAFEECLHNFPVSALEFTFSPQHFLEKKILAQQQQQKLGRRKFAQCPFVVIFITLKKMIDVETILEAKKKK